MVNVAVRLDPGIRVVPWNKGPELVLLWSSYVPSSTPSFR